MGISVTEFISNYKGGLRPNKFMVQLNFPSYVANSGASADVPKVCHAASIPGSKVDKIDVSFQGRKVPVRGDRTYDDWTATFYNDEGSNLHDAFIAWSNGLNDPAENISTPTRSTGAPHTQTVTVTQLNVDGTSQKDYTLHYAWPVSVGDIKLSWDTNNAVESFDVTFAYAYWD